MSGINLTPFGYTGDMQPVGDFRTDSLVRASNKLLALRERTPQPMTHGIGTYVGVGVTGLAGLGLFALGIAVVAAKNPVPAAMVVMWAFGAIFGIIAWRIWVDGLPTTPKRALNLFYRSLARGNASRAAQMVVPNDFDDYPRYQPQIQYIGTGINPRPFGAPGAFGDYWNEMLRYHTAPYCIARVSSVSVQEVAPDIVVVDFQLKLMMNTQLWIALVFIALLLAAIIDAATRKTVTVQMRKVLYRVGDQWHMFDAEWQGYEERDLSWVMQARGGGRL